MEDEPAEYEGITVYAKNARIYGPCRFCRRLGRAYWRSQFILCRWCALEEWADVMRHRLWGKGVYN